MKNSKGAVPLVNVGNEKRPPIALVYLASILRANGYNSTPYAVNTKQEIENTLCAIQETPDLRAIGFSVYLGDSAPKSAYMASSLKGKSPIIVGGKFPSSDPEFFLKEGLFDAVCVGDGEKSILQFLEDSTRRVYRNEPEQDLDSLPFDMDLLDWDKHVQIIEGKRTLIDCLETQRGCLWKCQFCFRMAEGTKTPKVPEHSIPWVIDKLTYLRDRHRIEQVSFADDEFWTRPDRAFDLLEAVRSIDMQVIRVRVRFNTIKRPGFTKKIQEVGVKTLALGLEAGTDRMLKLMRKGLTTKIAERVIRDNVRTRIEFPSYLIMGCPTETKKEFRGNIRFSIRMMWINRRFWVRPFFYTPYPGTPFYSKAVEAGFKPVNSLFDWGKMGHHESHLLGKQWLPWFTDWHERNYERGKSYLQIYRTLLVASSRHKWLYLVLPWIYLRLWLWNFTLPIEYKIWKGLVR